MTLRRRTALRFAAALAVVGALALAAGLFVIRSRWFENQVRERIVAATERATGGRAEIGRFSYDWRRLSAEVAPFVLHGKEPAGAPPLLRAEKVIIGWTAVSLWARTARIASLEIEKPEVRIIAAPDGSTNIPGPLTAAGLEKNSIELLLDLKIGRLAMRNGFVEYNSRRVPLDLAAQNVNAWLRFDGAGPRYAGQFTSQRVTATSSKLNAPLTFALDTKFAWRRNALEVASARLTLGETEVELAGGLTNFSSPRGEFSVKARVFPADLGKAIHLPVAARGEITYQGRASFAAEPFTYRIEGRVKGRNLEYSRGEIRVSDLALSSPIEITPDELKLTNLDARVWGGGFHGWFELSGWRRFRLEGTARGVGIRNVAAMSGSAMSGDASGPVSVRGELDAGGWRNVEAGAKLDISAGTEGVPLSGSIDARYDQQAGKLELGDSKIRLGETEATVSGTPGERLKVQASSRNLDDLLTALSVYASAAPKKFFAVLKKNGGARFNGYVSGPMRAPRITGEVEATRFTALQQDFDHLDAVFDLVESRLDVHSMTLTQGAERVQGSGWLGLANWRAEDASPLAASLAVSGADLAQWRVEGVATGTLAVKGTYGHPEGSATIFAPSVTAYGEQFTKLRANAVYEGNTVRVLSGEAALGAGRITATGGYTHGKSWKDGELRFEVKGARVALAQLKAAQDFRPGINGQVDGGASGAAHIVNGDFDLSALASEVSVRNVMVDGRQYGNVRLDANTDGSLLKVSAKADLRGSPVDGKGEWRLTGDYPGEAQIRIPRMSLATLHDLAPGPHARAELPFQGFVEGTARISGPLKKTDALKAEVVLDKVEVSAKTQDLALRNARPVRFDVTSKGAEVREARFVAKDTTLDATGRLAFDQKNPWDLNVTGTVNLAILQIFNPDLLGAGTSIIQATVRGALSEPQVDGRLELRNASLFLKDVPNGVDQANGIILFDRSRATVQTLTAMTGGGHVTFQPGSFVGFRGPSVLYHVQASAGGVRYRSPEGVSITVSALLSLSGTSESSVLSGTVTVERAGFNSQTDVGGLLAYTVRPIALSAAPSEYLRGLQFDVRILSAQTLAIQASLTRDVQAEANVRLRGSLEKPVVLGEIDVNSGEIEFFGNRYSINRGEIHFNNPAKLEPIVDMDLETRVRGITVDITFSGPLNKLNFSYRSDPPLEINQIIALLAVGRAPVTAGAAAGSQIVANESSFTTGGNALLGQAIAPSSSGRLQRFFGVSHIKIDPQLTDLTSVPQARLTLEQQISKDITLTYITNLTRTQEQIVRVQWDLNRRWSVVALRDENGAFGMDVQYRKRFK